MAGETDNISLLTLLGTVELDKEENNIVTLGNTNPVGFNLAGTSSFLNNQTPSGSLLQGYNRTSWKKSSEPATLITDAIGFTLFL